MKRSVRRLVQRLGLMVLKLAMTFICSLLGELFLIRIDIF